MLDLDSSLPSIQKVVDPSDPHTVETLQTTPNSYFGSSLRNGRSQTFFSMQVGRYADLYTSQVVNLDVYPPGHHFVAPLSLLPHERALANI